MRNSSTSAPICGGWRPGGATTVPAELQGAKGGGPTAGESPGGGVERRGGVGSLQAPRDELVAAGGAGPGGAGGGVAEWGVGPLASGPRTPRANAARADREGRLRSKTGAPAGERQESICTVEDQSARSAETVE